MAPGSRDGVHVVVVGAGAVGCAVAAELAREVRVTVVERDRIGGGATGRSAGQVTIVPAYSDYPAVASAAMAFFREHAGTGGFAFHERESVEFVPPDRLGEARRRAVRLAEQGLATDFVGRVDADTGYPMFDLADYVGLVRHREAGYLDPGQLVSLFARQARERGATVEIGTAATGIAVEDSTAVGVETDAGPIGADAVVLAAGWGTPQLLPAGVSLPVRPYRTQAVVLQMPARREWRVDLPMGWLPEERVYFRPMGRDRVLVGGFADPIDEPGAVSRDADPAFRRHVAELVPRLFADPEGTALVDGWAGVDLATPDTRPIIDRPVGGPSGLLVATGFHGRGVMTAPVAGQAAAARLLGSGAPFPLEPFDADRFDDASPEFPFLSTSSGRER